MIWNKYGIIIVDTFWWAVSTLSDSNLNKRRSRTAIFFVKVAQKWQIEHTTIDVKKDTHFREKKLSMEILMEEFKPT